MENVESFTFGKRACLGHLVWGIFFFLFQKKNEIEGLVGRRVCSDIWSNIAWLTHQACHVLSKVRKQRPHPPIRLQGETTPVSPYFLLFAVFIAKILPRRCEVSAVTAVVYSSRHTIKCVFVGARLTNLSTSIIYELPWGAIYALCPSPPLSARLMSCSLSCDSKVFTKILQ